MRSFVPPFLIRRPIDCVRLRIVAGTAQRPLDSGWSQVRGSSSAPAANKVGAWIGSPASRSLTASQRRRALA